MLIARHLTILDLARENGTVLVDDLAKRFQVSPQTIRKDLNQLCDEGVLARVHGGAILNFGGQNVGYGARQSLAGMEKESIGRRAAEQIPNGASLIINIGTTTEAVAQALKTHHQLMVITNNLNVAATLRVCPEIEVVVAGGVVRTSDGGIVGEAAVDFIKQFKVDYAIIGASALDREGALLDYDYREVKVAQAIIENARHVILVADQSKFERTAPVRIGSLAQVDTLIMDTRPEWLKDSWLERFDLTLIEACL
ncbi:DeoR/GlpR family DNA-binding transcription regulator [Polycladidibacter stylochi]|uniref:DeoR/GlpR family DNA-binding transcription regulator n=1 Tax=Polycladidibacter stylochi TaxID=1807766 RepID=UPI0008361201|nr:DeoR/GlpR family DNA-binding transcription regulator [Pseudovibrio stylochi]